MKAEEKALLRKDRINWPLLSNWFSPEFLNGGVLPLLDLDADPDVAEEDGGEGEDELGEVGEDSEDKSVLLE